MTFVSAGTAADSSEGHYFHHCSHPAPLTEFFDGSGFAR